MLSVFISFRFNLDHTLCFSINTFELIPLGEVADAALAALSFEPSRQSGAAERAQEDDVDAGEATGPSRTYVRPGCAYGGDLNHDIFLLSDRPHRPANHIT